MYSAKSANCNMFCTLCYLYLFVAYWCKCYDKTSVTLITTVKVLYHTYSLCVVVQLRRTLKCENA